MNGDFHTYAGMEQQGVGWLTDIWRKMTRYGFNAIMDFVIESREMEMCSIVNGLKSGYATSFT